MLSAFPGEAKLIGVSLKYGIRWGLKKGLVCRILSMLAKENVYWLFANISDKKRLLKLFLKRKKMTLLA